MNRNKGIPLVVIFISLCCTRVVLAHGIVEAQNNTIQNNNNSILTACKNGVCTSATIGDAVEATTPLANAANTTEDFNAEELQSNQNGIVNESDDKMSLVKKITEGSEQQIEDRIENWIQGEAGENAEWFFKTSPQLGDNISDGFSRGKIIEKGGSKMRQADIVTR